LTALPTKSHEHLLRELAPQVLGAIVRRYGNFAAAEDAVQEALLAAAMQWPNEGVPDNPRGWLIKVAARRTTDQLRSEIARRRRETELHRQEAPDVELAPPPEDAELGEHDDTLLLLFMCCHPVLTPASAIALTLRAVGGLTTAEIANAYLVPEATMAQRISRAKQTIKDSGVSFAMPTEQETEDRLTSVLHVLYLIFNEGYASSIGEELQRSDLVTEALRLTRAVHGQLPDDGDAPNRRAPRGAHGRERRAHPAREAGAVTLGPSAYRRRRCADQRGAVGRLDRRVSATGRDRGRA
jgi:RNA polymerase sigma factor (sigma-70 family)